MLNSAAEKLFAGTGEMRALCRAFDWSSTSLGAVDGWPVALRTTVKAMLASRHPMFLFWGPEQIQLFNDAYRTSFGGDGRHLAALGARGKEFWTEIWDTIGPQIAQVLAGGDATWFEDQFLPIWRNGALEDVYWTYSFSAAHDDNGDIAGVLVICQETTSQVALRQQLELESSRLSYAFEQAPSFVCVLRGPPYVFEFVNEAYHKLVGKQNLQGQLVFEAVPEARDQGFDTLLDGVVRTGDPFVGREIPIMLAHTPGAALEERLIDFVYFPITEVDGSRSGVIAHGVDVTEQVHARREVERLLLQSEQERSHSEVARRDADAANKAKGDFLAMLSHELRTPLAAISGYADLLSMGVHGTLSDGQKQYLDRIQHSQRHLLGLIDGLLIFSQAEAGKIQYHFADVPLGTLMHVCESMVAPQAKTRGLQLHTERCDDQLTAYGDSEKIQQIIINLLSNAIKFTDGGGTVTLRCDADETTTYISVIDSGVGIPAEDLNRVFDPFVQLDSKNSRNKGGTGLGLAISLTLARGMFGNLTVESVPAQGSSFTLSLPRFASLT